MPQEETSREKRPRKRRWVRRVLIAACVLFLLIIAIIIALPSIVTSRWAENRIEAIAAERIDRPVEIGDLRLGWRTPLSIDRVYIPPIKDEGEYSPLLLENLRVPLTLWELVRDRLPVNLSSIVVEKIEANLVRLPSGEWNWMVIANKATGPPKPKDEKPPTGPSPIPISELGIEVQQLDARVIVPDQNLVSGWENGVFEALWPGASQPITADLAGDFRVNDERMPWDARAKIADWVNANRILTTETAKIIASSDGMMGVHQIADGGFYIHASALAEDENVVRVVLPLARLRELANAAPLPAQAPEIGGEIDLALTFNHSGEFQQWDAELAINGTGLTTIVGDRQQYEIPPQDLRLDAVTSFNLEQRHLARLTTELASDFLVADVAVAELPFDDPLSVNELNIQLRADFGEATLLAANILGTAEQPPMEGTLALSATKIETDGAPSFALDTTFEPVVLRTLNPFTDDPDFLTTGPIDLTPLAFSFNAQAVYDLTAKHLDATIQNWRGAMIEELFVDASADMEPLRWNLATNGVFELAAPFDAFGERFAPTIQNASGVLRFDFAAAQPRAGMYDTSGSLAVNNLSLELQELAAPVVEEQLLLEWDLTAEPGTRSAEIAHLRVVSSFADVVTSGTISEVIDVAMNGEIDTGRVITFARPWMEQLPAQIGGVVAINASAEGILNETVAAVIEVESRDAFTYNQPGMITFSEPITLYAMAEVEYAQNQPAIGAVNIETLQLGDVLEATLATDFNLTESGNAKGAIAATLDYGAAIAVLDPQLWQERGFDFIADGVTELEIEFAGPLNKTDAGITYPEPWEASGSIVTELPAIEWAFNDMDGIVEGFFDQREFTAVFMPDNSTSPTYHDEAITAFNRAEGPRGVLVQNFEIVAAIEADMPNVVRYNLNNGSIAQGVYETETVAATVPRTTFKADLLADLSDALFTAKGVQLEIENAASLDSESSFAWERREWSTNTNLRVSNLGNAVTLVDVAGAETMGWVQTLSGTLGLSAELRGVVPENGFSYSEGLPLRGSIAIEGSDIGVEMPRRMVIAGIDLEGEALFSEDGQNADLALQSSISRFSNNAFQAKPIQGLRLDLTGALHNFDELDLALNELSAENYKLNVNGELNATNLRSALADESLEGMAKYLRNMRMSGDFQLRNELAGWSGFRDELLAEGLLDMALTLRNDPQTVFRASALTDLGDMSLRWGDLFQIEGMGGTWEASKTLLLTPQGRKPVSPSWGQFHIDRIGFATTMFSGAISEATVRVRGLEEGLTVDLGSRDVLNGSGKALMTLDYDEGDPLITGRVEVTGMDMARLARVSFDETRHEDELNATGTISWRIEENTGGRFLDDLTVELKSTRIGEDAFARLLRALDADQDDPRFQNALAALRIGTPVSSTFALQNSLATFRAELRLPAGIHAPLPILDRQPLGAILEVYDFDEYGPMIDLTRWGLLLVLSSSLDEFQENLAAPETNQ